MASSLIWGRYVVVKAEDDRSTTIDNGGGVPRGWGHPGCGSLTMC